MSTTGRAVDADEAAALPRSRGYGRLFKPLVTVTLYAVIFYYYVDERALLSQLASTHLPYVAAGVGIYVAGQLVSTWKWQILLRPVELTAGYAKLAAFYFIGMFFNIFLPTVVGGDAVKAILLARETGAPARATMAVFMERNVGLLALFSIAAVAAVRTPTRVALFGVSLLAWTLVLFAGFVAVNVMLMNERAYRAADRIIGLLPLGPLRPRATSLYDAVVPYTRAPSTMAAALLLSFVFQAVVIVVVFLNTRALGYSVPLSALAVIVPLVSLAGMLPSVNGLGVRDTLYILLFGQLGVTPDAALSLAILYFAVTLIASLPGGLVYALRRSTPITRS
jgi:glycosyltransferase 2 family protein